jgi:hypothetical protein
VFGVKKILEERGHQVVPFAINYAKDRETPYARYFAAPPVRSDVVLYKDAKLSPAQKLKLLAEVSNEADLAEKILAVMRDRELSAKLRAGALGRVEDFDVRKIVPQFEQLFLEATQL